MVCIYGAHVMCAIVIYYCVIGRGGLCTCTRVNLTDRLFVYHTLCCVLPSSHLACEEHDNNHFNLFLLLSCYFA